MLFYESGYSHDCGNSSFPFQGAGGAKRASGGQKTMRADRNSRYQGRELLREGFERVACRRFSAAATEREARPDGAVRSVRGSRRR